MSARVRLRNLKRLPQLQTTKALAQTKWRIQYEFSKHPSKWLFSVTIRKQNDSDVFCVPKMVYLGISEMIAAYVHKYNV